MQHGQGTVWTVIIFQQSVCVCVRACVRVIRNCCYSNQRSKVYFPDLTDSIMGSRGTERERGGVWAFSSPAMWLVMGQWACHSFSGSLVLNWTLGEWPEGRLRSLPARGVQESESMRILEALDTANPGAWHGWPIPKQKRLRMSGSPCHQLWHGPTQPAKGIISAYCIAEAWIIQCARATSLSVLSHPETARDSPRGSICTRLSSQFWAPSHLSRPGAALSGCLGCAWGANIQSLLMGKGTCPPGGGRSEQPTFPPGQMEGGTAPFQALENPWKFQFSISECKVFLSRGKMKGN